MWRIIRKRAGNGEVNSQSFQPEFEDWPKIPIGQSHLAWLQIPNFFFFSGVSCYGKSKFRYRLAQSRKRRVAVENGTLSDLNEYNKETQKA